MPLCPVAQRRCFPLNSFPPYSMILAFHKVHHFIISVLLLLFSLFNRNDGWKITESVKIKKGNQVFSVKNIQFISPSLGNVYILVSFTNHGGILAFCQRIIIAMPWTWFSQFNMEFVEKFGQLMIYIFWAIISMKSFDVKSKGFKTFL